MIIYCCGCGREVDAVLLSGQQIYPHRPDLFSLPFWGCTTCKNYVGCHHKTKNRTQPLGVIPTKELKSARKKIHEVLDPIWRSGSISRKALYAKISDQIGRKYHTANIRSISEARAIYKIVISISKELNTGNNQ